MSGRTVAGRSWSGRGLGLWIGMMVGGAALSPPAPAQQLFDANSLVTTLHQTYLGRPPSAEELTYWSTKLQQGTSSTEVHAAIIASDPVFARYGRDPGSWMEAVFTQVVHRPPQPAELQAWSARFQTLKGNREQIARELLASAGGNVAVTASRPTMGIATPQELPDQLIATAKLLTQSVTAEVAGPNGALARAQASSLEQYAIQGRNTLLNARVDPASAQSTMQSIDTAIQGVQTSLASSGVATPTSNLYLNQVKQLSAAIHQQNGIPTASISLPPPPPLVTSPVAFPGVPTTTLSAPAAAQLQPTYEALVLASQQSVFQVRSLVQQGLPYGKLQTEIENFANAVQALRPFIVAGVDSNTLWSRLLPLRDSATNISGLFSQGTYDGRIVQSWYDTVQALNRLLSQATAVAPPPPQSNASAPVGGNVRVSPNTSTAVATSAAAATAQCDVLLTSLQPLAFTSPAIPQLQNEIRALRGSLDPLRTPGPTLSDRAALDRQVAAVRAAEARVAASWNIASREMPGTALPPLTNLSQAIATMEAVSRQP